MHKCPDKCALGFLAIRLYRRKNLRRFDYTGAKFSPASTPKRWPAAAARNGGPQRQPETPLPLHRHLLLASPSLHDVHRRNRQGIVLTIIQGIKLAVDFLEDGYAEQQVDRPARVGWQIHR